MPIGRHRNKLPGVAPCTSLLHKKGMRVKDDGKVTRSTYDYQTGGCIWVVGGHYGDCELPGLTRMSLLNAGAQSLFSHDLSAISAIKEAAIFQVKCTRVLRDAVLTLGDKDALEDQRRHWLSLKFQ